MQAEALEQQIVRVSSAVGNAKAGERVNWREVWDDIKAIGEAFKSVRFPDSQQHQEAWGRFQAAVAAVKSEQTRQRERRERLAESSSNHLRHIQRLIDAAAPDDGMGDLIITAFTGGTNLIVKAAMDAVFGKEDDVFTELHRRSALVREAGQYLSANKAEMLGADKKVAFDNITRGRERLDADWASWKEAIRAAKETRHREYLERQARREERDAKQREWRERQISFIARMDHALERLGTARERRRTHIVELYAKRATAWSEGYRERVDEWISEEERNISDIEDKMRDVADKLADAKSKL